MKAETTNIVTEYCSKYAFVKEIYPQIMAAFELINNCFWKEGKLLVCGNGGSAADADHIVGELMKGFNKYRKFSGKEKSLYKAFGDAGNQLAEKLQYALPAINLCSQSALITAVINDIGGEEIMAQQVVGYGMKGDVLLGISTSGNSADVFKAGIAAKVRGLGTIALTGARESKMSELYDITVKVPSTITSDIQDMHSVVYHILCAMIESERWEE